MSEPRREFLKKVSRGRGFMYSLTGWTSNDIGIGIRKRWNVMERVRLSAVLLKMCCVAVGQDGA